MTTGRWERSTDLANSEHRNSGTSTSWGFINRAKQFSEVETIKVIYTRLKLKFKARALAFIRRPTKMRQLSDFQKLTQTFYKFFKPITTSGTRWNHTPQHFTQIQAWLSTAIQPAFSASRILIESNTTNWLQTGSQILEEHFQGTVDELQNTVLTLLMEDIHRAWAIASKWIRRDSPHIQTEIFEVARWQLLIPSPTTSSRITETEHSEKRRSIEFIPGTGQKMSIPHS